MERSLGEQQTCGLGAILGAAGPTGGSHGMSLSECGLQACSTRAVKP